MYIILHKKRNNCKELVKDIYDSKTNVDSEFVNLGGNKMFSEEVVPKEYYAYRLGFQAALGLAKVAQGKYKKELKEYLNKHLTIDILASESSHIVGVLIRYNKKLVAVLENWEIKNKEELLKYDE